MSLSESVDSFLIQVMIFLLLDMSDFQLYSGILAITLRDRGPI